jgi:hypothetical protein
MGAADCVHRQHGACYASQGRQAAGTAAMTDQLTFTYTDEQWNAVKAVVFNRLGRAADQIELTRPASKLRQMAAKLTRTDGSYTETTSLRSTIETAASSHIVDSALHSQTLGHKARVKNLKAMRDRAEALHNDLLDAMRPSFTLGGDDSVIPTRTNTDSSCSVLCQASTSRNVSQIQEVQGRDNLIRRVFLGGDLSKKYGLNVDQFDETGRAFATVTSVIDACIAAQRPQQTTSRNVSQIKEVQGRDNLVRRVFLGGDLSKKYGLNVDQFDETGRAFATVTSVIDACIAAQRPQQTANTRKAGRDRFWNEILAIWIRIGGEETGIAAAEFLVATSKPVFDKVRAIGGRKTTASMPMDYEAVVEWLRLRAKASRATTP